MKKLIYKVTALGMLLLSLNGCNQIKTVSALEEPSNQSKITALNNVQEVKIEKDTPIKEAAEETIIETKVESAPIERVETVWETVEQNDIQKEIIKDETLYEGETVLVQKGQKGIIKIAYELSYLDDELISKNQTGEKEIIQELKNEIVHVGTKSIQGNFNKDLSMKILEETNHYRNDQGQHSLQWDEQLYIFAKIRAEEISRLFSHTRPDGQAWDSVDDRVMGENLAKGYHRANLVVKAWVDSPGHRENLLRNYSKMASACFEDASGHMFIVQLFGY